MFIHTYIHNVGFILHGYVIGVEGWETDKHDELKAIMNHEEVFHG